MKKQKIEPGDRFSATIKKTEHSKTMALRYDRKGRPIPTIINGEVYGGVECAGKFCGTFIATGVGAREGVQSGDRFFKRELWELKKVELDI
jgi:hypothetical protein